MINMKWNVPKLREMMVEEINNHLGMAYNFGGFGEPIDHGLDCSGLAMRALWSAGFNLRDRTAYSLWMLFRECVIPRQEAEPGDLYFYGRPVNHVMVCYRKWNDKYRMLAGACSGNSSTKTLDEAWRRVAYVKIVRDTYWSNNLVGVVNPFKLNEGGK